MNRAMRIAIGLAVIAACSFMPARADVPTEVGAGAAAGTIACDTRSSSIAIDTDQLVYGDTIRTAQASIAGRGDCREWGAVIIGTGRITGPGLSCGHDAAKPLAGHFALTTPGYQVVGGLYGTCVIDGIERESRFAFNGAVIAGQIVGYLMPTGDLST